MSDTQNQWIPVSERLPDTAHTKLLRLNNKTTRTGYAFQGVWFLYNQDTAPTQLVSEVTHWMDLPEPPQPPQLIDPFEAWWNFKSEDERYLSAIDVVARSAWNAAKEHYAKPLPDFETWWVRFRDRTILTRGQAQAIWNAAQGEPEA